MKKIFVFLLAMTMLFSLAACGGNEETPSGSEDNTLSNSEQQSDKTVEVGSLLTLKLGVSIPEPEIEYSITDDASDFFNMSWNYDTITYDQVRNYAKRVEAAGFSNTGTYDDKEANEYMYQGTRDNINIRVDMSGVWVEIAN